MKRSFFLILLSYCFAVLLLFFKTNSLFAAGPPCCDPCCAYDTLTGMCVCPPDYLPSSMGCGAGEICQLSGTTEYCPDDGLNKDRGTCIAVPPTSKGGIDIQGDCNPGEIDTALGCIPIQNTAAFVKWLLRWAVLIAGGIAFLLILSGSLMVIISGGDPNKVKAGSELITSAIAGLLFTIFSLFLLRLIGIEVLQIPGL